MQSQDKVDQDLYSRQLAVYGQEAMGKLVKLRVFLHGLKGVGIETAKNLILAGPGAVYLHDDDVVAIQHLGVNFYVNESNVGKQTLAEASLHKLQELNPYVKVDMLKGKLTEQTFKDFDVVVFTDFYDIAFLKQANEFCRKNKKGFIYGGNLGLYGFCFDDFSDAHKISDKNGEENKTAFIVKISNEQNEKGLIICNEDKRHDLEEGDYVEFNEVEGMVEINKLIGKITKINSSTSFTVDIDTSKFSKYIRKGVAQQVKVPFDLQFYSLEQSLNVLLGPNNREVITPDLAKIGRPEQLHVIFNGFLQFVQQNGGQLPKLNDEADAAKLVQIVNNYNEESKKNKFFSVDKVEEQLIKFVSYYSRAQITCLASFWGGVVAQEIVKFTGKFSPIHQWLHFDAFEALPSEQVDRKLENSRYDSLIAIFGKQFLNKIQNLNVFMVGAGALGCEYLKQFSLLGMCAGNKGRLRVTDNDQIEISNLNRQFLFRKDDVKKFKSECACKASKVMNKDLKAESLQKLVSPETEDYFDDAFWNGVDFLVNAVDNIKARLFIDAKCVWYLKPLFESGTLGTKCNSQIILPKLSASYSESNDPAEKQIPLCTLKNFPYLIDHCIQWARDYFEGVFSDSSAECIKYLDNPKKFCEENFKQMMQQASQFRTRLENVKKISLAFQKANFEVCVHLARELFQDIFYNQIAQLLHCFPADHKLDDGRLFWDGTKRVPNAIEFNPNDETHIDFIQATANIFAFMFGMKYCHDRKIIQQISSKIQMEKFQPKKIKIKTDEKDTTEEKGEDDEIVVQKLAQELIQLKIQVNSKMQPIQFEKDDPTNWHIEFVTAVTNLRARNYSIQEVDKLKVKIISGKIIPAIATTTAMIVGAVGMEIIKFVQNKPLSEMKNLFSNLALPLWVFSEPNPPAKAKKKAFDQAQQEEVMSFPPEFSTWDKLDVKGPMTIEKFMQYFQQEYKISVSCLLYGPTLLYMTFQPGPNLKKDIKTCIEEMTKTKFSAKVTNVPLGISGNIQDGDNEISVTTPTIRYFF